MSAITNNYKYFFEINDINKLVISYLDTYGEESKYIHFVAQTTDQKVEHVVAKLLGENSPLTYRMQKSTISTIFEAYRSFEGDFGSDTEEEEVLMANLTPEKVKYLDPAVFTNHVFNALRNNLWKTAQILFKTNRYFRISTYKKLEEDVQKRTQNYRLDIVGYGPKNRVQLRLTCLKDFKA